MVNAKNRKKINEELVSKATPKILSKTNEVVKYLIDLIVTRKVPVNKIMPSEHALMEMFKCSRSVVVGAYQKLYALGAVYTISKRGHFVAENFYNLIKPVSFLMGADRVRGIEIEEPTEPDWFHEKRIIFVEGFRQFRTTYEIEGKVIAEADIFLSIKNVDQFEPISLNKPIIDTLAERSSLTNIVYELKYENVKLFGEDKLVVITMWGYDNESISIAAKFYIKPENFIFFHQEFSLY
ncbi:winged helix-turn-helix transcriptional regulator [Mycoplasma sp. CSL10137]|uniref:winged helix-turn-helix domain-containing protein n=1 Tax=unclassified Mycoplasma TaxID=2683645 RepID=UPI00197B35F0|nr:MULTISPECIES: winged helix-turn-helix domain-containing protein [unclassified Mycoplasma]MBN4083595.1 winged helix-turn-helix transcriptional regulator [Mycoplasma sp. CSL10137]MBN4084124.1 winged helix-turn-helix transcriptional regulator [Mycoplasma sp. CSL10166]MBU4693178.1 winged helix-turn-helix domain-containing protein [Mycoplasma sp. CSL7491-lung]MCU4706566.1 winged helix-turn-helix domain-containing protein [Mycoplasma sp. CSL7503-lung]